MRRSVPSRRPHRVGSRALVAIVAAGLAASILPLIEPSPASATPGLEAGLSARASAGVTDTPLTPAAPVATSGVSTFGQWWTNADGSRTERLFTEPTFRREDGKWARVDTTVRDATGDAALAAESAVLPTRFFGDKDRVVELTTDKGPLSLAASGLSIGEPKLVDGVVEYRNVAKDTDLRYRVLADSVKEEIVLGSAAAPRSFRFHLSDPAGQLGRVSRQPDGSWRFDGHVGPDLSLVLPPAFAYEDKGPWEAVPVDPSSASLKVRPVEGGYDLTISVDETWLAGKSFPIILDPTLNLTGASGTAIDGFSANGSSGGFSMNTTEPYLLTGSSSTYALRSFLRFNVSQVPFHSPVTSAQLGLWNGSCVATGGSGCPATPYSLRLRTMTGPWSASTTWNALSALISPSDLASVSGQANVMIGWQTFDLTSQVQKWVNLDEANNGMALRVVDETLGRSGPAWASSEEPDASKRPYLQVTYATNPSNGYPPANPGSSYSFGGGGLVNTVGAVPPAPRRGVFEALDHSLFGWYRDGNVRKYAQWNLGASNTPFSSGNSFAGLAQDATGAGNSIWAIGKPLARSNAVETRWDYTNGTWTELGGALGDVAVGSPLGTGPLTTWRDSRNGRIWAAYLAPVVVGTTTETHLFTAQSTDAGATFGSETDLGAPFGSTPHSSQFVPLPSGGVGLLHHGDGIRWYPSATGASSTVVFTPTAPQTEFTMSWQAAATDDGIVHLLIASPGSPLNHYRLVSGLWSVYTMIDSGY